MLWLQWEQHLPLKAAVAAGKAWTTKADHFLHTPSGSAIAAVAAIRAWTTKADHLLHTAAGRAVSTSETTVAATRAWTAKAGHLRTQPLGLLLLPWKQRPPLKAAVAAARA